jgi:hypothetical protein
MAVDAPGAVGVRGILEDYDRLLLAADHAPWLLWLRMPPERPGGGSEVVRSLTRWFV